MKLKIKKTLSITALICVILIVSSACTAGVTYQPLKNNIQKINQETSQSQHWALLFAVGVYLNAPDQDRPSMLEACDDLYDCLLSSPEYWKVENIHMLKGSQATLQNLIKELLWLIRNSRKGDHVLVYITTHGNHLYNPLNGQPWDLPPKDEADGSDEILVMYNGFDKWYGIIWDDLLNFFLSLIRCTGLCLIVDSCYSGGFNDPPLFDNANQQTTFTAQSFSEGFVKSLAGQGRVILMSSEENTVSYGSYFSNFLTYGFSGYGDSNGNKDGINSAEEAFAFAKPWTELWVYLMTGYQQSPTISDLYPGEFPVTTS